MCEIFGQRRVCKKIGAGFMVNVRQDLFPLCVDVCDPAEINVKFLLLQASGKSMPCPVEFIRIGSREPAL